MKDEATYPIGDYRDPRTETATTIAPAVGRVRPLDAKTKGRRRNTERQTPVRADRHVANGFLRCSFLPKLKETQTIQACRKSQQTERDFYRSLSQLAGHYNIEPMQTKGYGYPYNMALAMWDMETKLKQVNVNWDGFHLLQDNGKTFLVSKERYDTGTTLYYIPIVPLFQMLHDPKRKKTAQLLVSVCSYLYHIADIPYYRQEGSYLYWQYEMFSEWVEYDDCTDDTESYKSELRKAGQLGDIMEQKLYNRINLQLFEQRLNRFKSRDAFDEECRKVACDALALYRDYPNATIFRNAQMPGQVPYIDDYGNETIGMEKYISFVADTKGWLYERLADCINNEFNEYGTIEEPTLCKRFDGSKITATDLGFENRLFALLGDLCGLLHEYKTTGK
ncbi:hypothetical protein OOZ15_12365 [Galbibacter sp. EGI 63066]|uniref:hypothetical protein n=1 Tax=Galbibacter sp. EGI 63066 TaxID=2993559 RepID=UPI002249762B|nr:hypothetical protein [Galbibacter sp. EGI 63066]MCX2680738.1 hypothetical protein [Galbibacter sp. EGI 63066]